MPPATIVGTAAGTVVGDTITFQMPLRAQEGDVLLAVLAFPPGIVSSFEVDAAGTHDNALITDVDYRAGALADLFVVQLPFSSDIGATLTLIADASPLWSLAALLVAREFEVGAASVEGSADVAASTNFACPSLVLPRYSELYVGVAVVTSAATAVTPPAGCVEHIERQVAGRTLAVFTYYHEANTATGAKTATTGAAQSGLAAALAYRAKMTLPAVELKQSAPGAIGFVDIGV